MVKIEIRKTSLKFILSNFVKNINSKKSLTNKRQNFQTKKLTN